jgi:hypothetical protein
MLTYSEDHEALEGKREELLDIAFSVLGDEEAAHRLVRALCRLTPPQDPPNIVEMITVHSMGARGGRSRKPGNVLVNFRKLVEDFGDIGLAVGAGAADYRLVPLAAMAIWSKVWKQSAIDLSEDEASLVYAMWLGRDDANLVSREEAFEMFRLLRRDRALPDPDDATFSKALDRLLFIEAIDWHKTGKLWLREWVRRGYS